MVKRSDDPAADLVLVHPVGLALMVLLSVLPVGLLQAWAALEYGTWYAWSAEFLQAGLRDRLRWMRVIGDTIEVREGEADAHPVPQGAIGD